MNPRILAIDDDPDILEVYSDILGAHGFGLTGVGTRDAALDALRTRGPWDVVLLDEKLLGRGGPSSAAAMLLDIASLAPSARTIVITGFATPDLVKEALHAGAWDYLEKDGTFLKLLLPLRVRHAVEAARERQLGRTGPAAIEGELRRTWAAVQAGGGTSQQRGRLLEETLCLLFRTIPGLDEARVNVRSTSEEFDVVVPNASTHPILAKEGSLILVECKNWSGRVDPREIDYLRTKLRDRRGRASLGLLVSINGFTAGVDEKLARVTNEEWMVVPVDGPMLDAWIGATDRLQWLVTRLADAALRV